MMGATWDMRTIDKVGRLWISVDVDVTAPFEWHVAAREKAAEVLKIEAEALAVDLHVEDVAFSARERSDVHATTYRAYWSPSTRVVEFVGGAADGRLLEVGRVGDSVRMFKPPPVHAWMRLTEGPLATFGPISETYELVGWREVERRWVHEVLA